LVKEKAKSLLRFLVGCKDKPLAWFLLGCIPMLVVFLVFSGPLRCVLEYRIAKSEALVALIGLLVAGIGAVLVLVLPTETRRFVWSLWGGVFVALALFVVVNWLLPPIPQDECTPPTRSTTPSPALPEIMITEVRNDGKVEHVVIYNASAVDVDLTGWKLMDSTGNFFTFPAGYILPPKATVRIHSGEQATEENPPSDLSWTSKNIWNNDHDTAQLYDAQGNLRDDYQY